MTKTWRIFGWLVLAVVLLSCNITTLTPTPTEMPTPTETIAPPTETLPIPTATATQESTSTATPSGPCEIVAAGDATVYQRPSSAAQVFGVMGAGERILAQARTADGWLGFDPGVAQAANVGIFRLRWVEEGVTVHLEGDCSGLPVVEGPPPGVCFMMPMTDVTVYALPDTTSAVITTMAVGDYAAVLGRNAAGWAKLDLSLGNLGIEQQGWVEGDTLNMNGPCADLPTIEP